MFKRRNDDHNGYSSIESDEPGSINNNDRANNNNDRAKRESAIKGMPGVRVATVLNLTA